MITIKFNVMKNGMQKLGMKSPIYIPGPVEPNFGPGRYLYFGELYIFWKIGDDANSGLEGFSVDQHGKQHYMDA